MISRANIIGLFLASAAMASGTCLNPDPSSCSCDAENAATASFTDCCADVNSIGSETLNNIDFTYECAKYPKRQDVNGLSATTAQQCALLCAANPSCAAAGWDSAGFICHLSTDDSGDTARGRDYILVRKNNFTPPAQQCANQIQDAVEQAERQCTAEKNTLEEQLRQCTASTDPACWANSGGNLCDSACSFDEFSVHGIQVRKICDRSIASSYGHRREAPIKECIQQCSQQGDCVGVQGTRDGKTCWIYTDKDRFDSLQITSPPHEIILEVM